MQKAVCRSKKDSSMWCVALDETWIRCYSPESNRQSTEQTAVVTCKLTVDMTWNFERYRQVQKSYESFNSIALPRTFWATWYTWSVLFFLLFTKFQKLYKIRVATFAFASFKFMSRHSLVTIRYLNLLKPSRGIIQRHLLMVHSIILRSY